MIDHYSILGVFKTAPSEEIKKVYRKKAIKFHPDKNPNNTEEVTKNLKKFQKLIKFCPMKENGENMIMK